MIIDDLEESKAFSVLSAKPIAYIVPGTEYIIVFVNSVPLPYHYFIKTILCSITGEHYMKNNDQCVRDLWEILDYTPNVDVNSIYFVYNNMISAKTDDLINCLCDVDDQVNEQLIKLRS